MPGVRLVIKNAELVPEGILIRQMEIIDTESGESLKIAELNQQLVDYFKIIEIDVTDYLASSKMAKMNPAFRKLCDGFRLYK